MAFCVLKENISARTCPNQRINKVILAVKYNVFIAVKIVDHTTVSRILGLAWLTLRKWLPMLAKLNIVFSVSQFFVKKTMCLVTKYNYSCENDLCRYNKKRIRHNPTWNFCQSQITLASWNFWQSKKKLFPTYCMELFTPWNRKQGSFLGWLDIHNKKIISLPASIHSVV